MNQQMPTDQDFAKMASFAKLELASTTNPLYKSLMEYMIEVFESPDEQLPDDPVDLPPTPDKPVRKARKKR